ncbi:MAG: hypothetical protein JW808_10595, partial [Victivallales bacterium]|nr:hypothetical protein [Victivallales bacterium]
AVFSRDLSWVPGDNIPIDGGEFAVLDASSAKSAENAGWEIGRDPKGVLDGVFLGTEPAVRIDPPKSPSTRKKLVAGLRGSSASFLCVMAPHDELDGRGIEIPESGDGRIAVVKSPGGMDIVAGSCGTGPVKGEIETDASIAVVSLSQGNVSMPSSYAMAEGGFLRKGETVIVSASNGNADVMNDGSCIVIRADGGCMVDCLRLAATRLVVNGKDVEGEMSGDRVKCEVPDLPKDWNITVSEDGRTVSADGDGLRPLKIEAPDAVSVIVNGVERHYVRNADGEIFVCLDEGVPTLSYRHIKEAAQLKSLTADDGRMELVDSESVSKDLRIGKVLLAKEGEFKFTFPIFWKTRYDLTLDMLAPGAEKISLDLNGEPLSFAEPDVKPGQPFQIKCRDIPLSGNSAEIRIKGSSSLAVIAMELAPVRDSLPASQWMVTGPFASSNLTADEVSKIMEEKFGPENEKDLRLDAVYDGKDGRKIRWVPGDSKEGIAFLPDGKVPYQWTFPERAPSSGVNFLQPCGVRNKDLCFALLYIESPDDRMVPFWLGCDWWANVYINGNIVVSGRDGYTASIDGAQFSTDTLFETSLTLKKGMNTLLVKSAGGNGSNSFMAYIGNLGDLKIVRKAE